MKIPVKRTLPLQLVAVLLIGCGDAKLAPIGEDDEIIVFADSTTWLELEPTLRFAFEDTVFTPQPERWFTLRRVDFEQFGAFERHKNRLIVAPLDGTGAVAEYVRQSLDPQVRKLVEEQKEFYFTKYDSRARNQLLMFLTGVNSTILKHAIENHAADLLYYFHNMALKRETQTIMAEEKYHKKEIEKKLEEKYGWTMTIQHDYFVAIDSASARFFWVRRANPADMERWIFVHWIDTTDPTILTDAFVLALRDTLTRRFLRTVDDDAYVQIAPYHLSIEKVNFLDRFAYETRGNWRFSDKSGGGPFVNYTLYDEATGRIYMLDGSIFAPRVEKKKLIWQVDALLRTFRTFPRSEKIQQQQSP
jgi:hypothetical protein